MVDELSAIYTSPFALDFAYEEWAAPYESHLHATFLEVVERSVLEDVDTAACEHALELARRAVKWIRAPTRFTSLLVRLYRRIGAHAAAAEQYATYSVMLRNDLGIEPPPFEPGLEEDR